MSAIRTVLSFALLTTLVGCPKKETDDDEDTKKPTKTAETAATPAPAPTPTTPPTSEVKIDNPGSIPGVEVKVKSEVDNRADGISGTALNAAGAKANLQHAKEWKAEKKGDFTVAAAPDNKAHLSAGAAGADKVNAAAEAMGLANCQWNPAESVTVGKDKLAGNAADGICERGPIKVKAAMVSLSAENLLVLGAWEDGGDSANAFGAMRAIAKAGTGGGGGINACCAALRQNAKSAPPQQQGAYLLAAGACQAASSNPNTAQALAAVRAAARGVSLPGVCQ